MSRHNIIGCFLLLATCLLTFFPLYKETGIPMGNDWAVPQYSHHLSNWMLNGLYIWSDSGSVLGYKQIFSLILPIQLVGVMLQRLLNISAETYIKSIIVFSYFVGSSSVFILLRRYKFGLIPAFIGGLIYVFNPVTFDFLLSGWMFALFSIFLFPLYLLLIDKYGTERKPEHLIYAGLIYGVAFMESQSIVYFPIIASLYLIFKSRLRLQRVIVAVLLVSIIGISLHLHWLLPLFLYPDPSVTASISNYDIGRFSLRFSYQNLLRGWGSVYNYQFETAFNKSLILFSYLPALFLVMSKIIKNKVTNRNFMFFTILFYFVFIIYLINRYLFFLPFTAVLRDFNRSSPYFFLSISFFAAYLSNHINCKDSRINIIIKFMFLILIVLFAHPYFNGNLYKAKVNSVGVSDEGIDQRIRLFVPEKAIRDFDLKINNQERVLLLPTGGSYVYPNNLKFNSNWASMLDTTIMYSNGFRGFFLFGGITKYLYGLGNDMADNFVPQCNISFMEKSYLGEFISRRFRYVAVKKNTINLLKNVSGREVDICLRKISEYFELIINDNDLSIYKVKHPLPLIYSAPDTSMTVPEKAVTAYITGDNNEAVNRQLPILVYVKVNPTKYRIKMENTTKPSFLAFSESFHKGWKLYINDTDNADITADKTDKTTESTKRYGEIVASYFDGEIKEGTHRNIFLDKYTFETWGKKPIPEKQHIMANGYANSWLIEPSLICADVNADNAESNSATADEAADKADGKCTKNADGSYDMEIILEFQPQRYFYIGLAISGTTLIICLLYLVYDFTGSRKALKKTKSTKETESADNAEEKRGERR